jgi:hypothetical protein
MILSCRMWCLWREINRCNFKDRERILLEFKASLFILKALVVAKARVGGFAMVVVFGFCGSLFLFCFLFLGVSFVYFLCI